MAAAAVIGVLTVAAGALSAYSSRQEGKAAQAAHNFNAATALQQASQERAAARLEEYRVRVKGRKAASSIRARAGASGVLATGSVLDVLEESAVNSEQDALLAKFQGENKAVAFERESALQTFYGKTAKQQGNLKAASTILATGAKAVSGV